MLRVFSVGPQDEGVYQCMAENWVGGAQAATRLVTVPSGTFSLKSEYRNVVQVLFAFV